MSTVVNGHREDESAAHTRPHGHILPMLSFSASTPTDEENPLDTNPAIAIDMTLWEQNEDAVDASQVADGGEAADSGRNPETVPLIDVDRAVVLIDGPVEDDDDEPDENAPLLAGGGGGGRGMTGGGGGGGCSDDGDSGVGGLGIPVNMPRRSSSHIGIALENGDAHGDMESSIASFLRSKSESENLASSATTNSPEEPGDQLENDLQMTSVCELRDVASQIVSEVLNQAQVQATTKTNANAKEEAAVAATAVAGGGSGGAGSGGGAQNLASPTSAHAERVFRGGPWYVQMGRVFSSFLSRICPCRCPTKP